MNQSTPKRKPWSFSLRSLMIAIAVVALLLFVFLAEYDFTSVVDTASSQSPDGKRTIVVELKDHNSLYRRFKTIEAKIYVGQNETPGSVQHHWLGEPETESSIPPDYQKLGAAAIKWSADSNSVAYHITDIESATIFFGKDNRKTEIHRHVQANGE